MVEAAYSFFRHEQCEYFPCHNTETPENFNCLFCYCPLYALDNKCGGNFSYTVNGVKDCSGCLLPHEKDNYGYITGRLAEIGDIMREHRKGKQNE